MNSYTIQAVFALSLLVVTLFGHCTDAGCGAGCCPTCGVVPAPVLPPAPAPAPVPVPAPVTYTVQVPVPAPVSYVSSCGFVGCGGCGGYGYSCGGCGGYGYGCGKK